MVKLSDIKNVSDKELKNFGLLMGVLVPLFFSLILPWLFKSGFKIVPVYIGLFFLAVTLVYPRFLKYVYIPWMLLGGVLGFVNTKIILSLIFFIVFSPVGIYFKIIKRDFLQQDIDKNALTYKKINNVPFEAKSMERPF
ncbi:MAG: SxtJ family membrane protein [Bacteriovoracaceae bacterium]